MRITLQSKPGSHTQSVGGSRVRQHRLGAVLAKNARGATLPGPASGAAQVARRRLKRRGHRVPPSCHVTVVDGPRPWAPLPVVPRPQTLFIILRRDVSVAVFSQLCRPRAMVYSSSLRSHILTGSLSPRTRRLGFAHGHDREHGAIACPSFSQDRANVFFHRLHGDSQFGGNLFVSQTTNDHGAHLLLSGREVFRC